MQTTNGQIPSVWSFERALTALKQGHRVARDGWNGKGMWLALVRPQDLRDYGVLPLLETNHPAYDYNMAPWIGMKTADNMFVPWLASQTDLLAEDWVVL